MLNGNVWANEVLTDWWMEENKFENANRSSEPADVRKECISKLTRFIGNRLKDLSLRENEKDITYEARYSLAKELFVLAEYSRILSLIHAESDLDKSVKERSRTDSLVTKAANNFRASLTDGNNSLHEVISSIDEQAEWQLSRQTPMTWKKKF